MVKRTTLYVRYQVNDYSIYCVVVLNARAELRINKNFVEMKLWYINYVIPCSWSCT